jgi:hypothetical protein
MVNNCEVSVLNEGELSVDMWGRFREDKVITDVELETMLNQAHQARVFLQANRSIYGLALLALYRDIDKLMSIKFHRDDCGYTQKRSANV